MTIDEVVQGVAGFLILGIMVYTAMVVREVRERERVGGD
jgi:hypothetical protein